MLKVRVLDGVPDNRLYLLGDLGLSPTTFKSEAKLESEVKRLLAENKIVVVDLEE